MEQESTEGDSSVEQALKIPLILDQIFATLNTKFLLSSCRLVNKIWCKESSRFIHNYRECKVVQNFDETTCKFLENVDCDLGKIVEEGRAIPYNGLVISAANNLCRKCGAESIDEMLHNGNLKKNLKLKYLDLFSHLGDLGMDNDCRVHHPLAALLREKSSELENLKFWKTVPPLEDILGEDWCLLFPKLQILDISEVYFQDEFTDEGKLAVEKLLSVAPKLKRIIVGHVTQLELIPEQKIESLCELQPEFDFRMTTNEDLRLLEMMPVKGSSRIKSLKIFVPLPPFNGQSEGNQLPEDEFVDVLLRTSFDHACHRLLQTCHSNLEEISIHGVFPLGEILGGSPLSKVSKFKVTKRYPGETWLLWESIRNIDYQGLMPALEKMEITIHTSFDNGQFDGDSRYAFPDDTGDAIYHSNTVRELTLELQVPWILLRPIKAVFPNVTTLYFKVPNTSKIGFDIAPLTDIWKHFPLLEYLGISGAGGYVHRNYDADFCGLNEQEVELLWEQSEDYLRNVHIVPIRPSIVTMSNLRILCVQFSREGMWFRSPESSSQDALRFISKVTRLVALDRMSQLGVCIPSCMESPEIDDKDSNVKEDFGEETEEESEKEKEKDDGDVRQEDGKDVDVYSIGGFCVEVGYSGNDNPANTSRR